MNQHPLLELAANREVRQVKGFKKAAADLTGDALAEMYRQEITGAPVRELGVEKFFVPHSKRRRVAASPARNLEDLSASLVHHCRTSGDPLALPEEGTLDLLDYQIPLKSKGDKGAEANKGLGKLDLFGIVPDDRMAVAALRFVPPSATRGSTGDTPLRALLEALLYAAIAEANREVLTAELESDFERKLSDAPPVVIVLGNKRYWELCRKREAQKGALWISEMERLRREIDASCGVEVHYLGLDLTGDPGWVEEDAKAVLEAPPKLTTAWEPGAGRKKPRPRSKPKVDNTPTIIEADPTRPVRPYAPTETFTVGDSIAHPTLGNGVVQSVAGPGKIHVLIEGTDRVLVHGRAPAPS